MGSELTVPVEAAPDRFWDTYSRYYDCVYQLMPYRKLLWDVYQALELQPGMRVLDAGCGTGNFEHFISEKSPPAIEIDAVDFSPGMLSRAERKCSHLDNVTFAQADLTGSLPFPDATFDRIVSINVLYALPRPDSALGELARVLKPNGHIVLTGPAPGYGWGPLVAEHFQRVRNIWGVRRRISTVTRNAGVIFTSMAVSFALNVRYINSRARSGEYHILGESELRELLETQADAGLHGIAITNAFAGQNLFATARKSEVAYVS